MLIFRVYCDRSDIKPLSTADFGKVMKQVFPGIRPRRLGTRGHSRYCYAAMRKTSKLPPPHLPTLSTTTAVRTSIEDKDATGESRNIVQVQTTPSIIDSTDEQEESWHVIKQWAENMLHVKVESAAALANHLKKNNSTALTHIGTHAVYTGASTPKSSNAGAANKKAATRESKEKRVLVVSYYINFL